MTWQAAVATAIALNRQARCKIWRVEHTRFGWKAIPSMFIRFKA